MSAKTVEKRMADQRREEQVRNIRAARAWADLMESCLDEVTGRFSATGRYYHPGPYDQVKDDMARFVRAMLDRGAKITKDYGQGSEPWVTMAVTATFPEGTAYADVGEVVAIASRHEVCERVVIGEREVTESVPDPEAMRGVPLVEVTRKVEDVEWVCHPIMGDAGEAG